MVQFQEGGADDGIHAGQSPPQVTMPARVSLGSKKSFSRGPASSKKSSSGGVTPGVRTMCNGMRASSPTECRIGDAKRAGRVG